MLERSRRVMLYCFLAVALLAMTITVAAQDGSRELTPGLSVDGTISDDGLAQVFTYVGTSGQAIKLTLISADGLALGVLLTDATGEPLAQGTDDQGNGFLVLDNIDLDADDTYFVTVFPLAVEDLPTRGDFSISLALSSGTPADVVEAAEPTESTESTTEEADTAVVDAATAEATEAVIEEIAAPELPGDTTAQTVQVDGIQVALTWNATADFNLEVRDPVGGTLFWDSVLTESGGTFETGNVNGDCEGFTADSPTESASWTTSELPAGTYEVLVFYVQDCENNGAVSFTVDATVDQQALSPVNGTILPGQTFLTSFVIAPNGSVTIRNGGIDQQSLPAPSADLIAAAEAVTPGNPIDGAITNEQVVQSYSFTAAAGDVITASLEATSGSLDPYLFLLNESGQVVTQNDDADDTTLNSQIVNQVLDLGGTYTLVATRYGQAIGGTEGEFVLTLSGATTTGGAAAPIVGQTVPDGIIEVSLVWDTNADLQLLVRDPVGDAVFDDDPTIGSGGQLVLDGNANCEIEENPASYIIWPEGQRVRSGTYEIEVWYQNNCTDTTPVGATLTVGIAGEEIINEAITPLLQDRFVVTFTINDDGTIVRGPGGIIGGSETIDYTSELPSAPNITANLPVQSAITDDNRFDVYTFTGTAGDVVTVRMEATSGNLDPLLFLLGPNGVELIANDDIIPGTDRNSLISEFSLPQSGQYVVLATHFATIYGGTNGTYTLTLTTAQ